MLYRLDCCALIRSLRWTDGLWTDTPLIRILPGICIFASAYDVIFQIFHPANPGDPPNYKNLAVFAGSYVLLVSQYRGLLSLFDMALQATCGYLTFMPDCECSCPGPLGNDLRLLTLCDSQASTTGYPQEIHANHSRRSAQGINIRRTKC